MLLEVHGGSGAEARHSVWSRPGPLRWFMERRQVVISMSTCSAPLAIMLRCV